MLRWYRVWGTRADMFMSPRFHTEAEVARYQEQFHLTSSHYEVREVS